MKAVFEEVNGDYATFIPDDIQKTYRIPIEELPIAAEIGDVFKIEILEDGKIKLLKNLPEERKKREQSAQEKRRKLLKRKKRKE